MISEMIKDYTVSLSALASAIAVIIALVKFVIERRDAHYWKEFDVYHKLVKELVEPDKETNVLYVDRQAAIVFELRNFKRYYPISLRMLVGLSPKFEEGEKHSERLKQEFQLTIKFFKKKLNISDPNLS